jgi:hypothetical protein
MVAWEGGDYRKGRQGFSRIYRCSVEIMILLLITQYRKTS